MPERVERGANGALQSSNTADDSSGAEVVEETDLITFRDPECKDDEHPTYFVKKLVITDLKLKCPRCESYHASQKELCQHLRMHPNPRLCPMCGHQAKTEQNLVKHVRRHTDERPYACPEPDCVWAFKQKGDLLQHIRRGKHGKASKNHRRPPASKLSGGAVLPQLVKPTAEDIARLIQSDVIPSSALIVGELADDESAADDEEEPPIRVKSEDPGKSESHSGCTIPPSTSAGNEHGNFVPRIPMVFGTPPTTMDVDRTGSSSMNFPSDGPLSALPLPPEFLVSGSTSTVPTPSSYPGHFNPLIPPPPVWPLPPHSAALLPQRLKFEHGNGIEQGGLPMMTDPMGFPAFHSGSDTTTPMKDQRHSGNESLPGWLEVDSPSMTMRPALDASDIRLFDRNLNMRAYGFFGLPSSIMHQCLNDGTMHFERRTQPMSAVYRAGSMNRYSDFLAIRSLTDLIRQDSSEMNRGISEPLSTENVVLAPDSDDKDWYDPNTAATAATPACSAAGAQYPPPLVLRSSLVQRPTIATRKSIKVRSKCASLPVAGHFHSNRHSRVLIKAEHCLNRRMKKEPKIEPTSMTSDRCSVVAVKSESQQNSPDSPPMITVEKPQSPIKEDESSNDNCTTKRGSLLKTVKKKRVLTSVADILEKRKQKVKLSVDQCIFRCKAPSCRNSFTTEERLSEHMALVHPCGLYQCPFEECLRPFKKRATAVKHVVNCHKGNEHDLQRGLPFTEIHKVAVITGRVCNVLNRHHPRVSSSQYSGNSSVISSSGSSNSNTNSLTDSLNPFASVTAQNRRVVNVRIKFSNPVQAPYRGPPGTEPERRSIQLVPSKLLGKRKIRKMIKRESVSSERSSVVNGLTDLRSVLPSLSNGSEYNSHVSDSNLPAMVYSDPSVGQTSPKRSVSSITRGSGNRKRKRRSIQTNGYDSDDSGSDEHSTRVQQRRRMNRSVSANHASIIAKKKTERKRRRKSSTSVANGLNHAASQSHQIQPPPAVVYYPVPSELYSHGGNPGMRPPVWFANQHAHHTRSEPQPSTSDPVTSAAAAAKNGGGSGSNAMANNHHNLPTTPASSSTNRTRQFLDALDQNKDAGTAKIAQLYIEQLEQNVVTDRRMNQKFVTELISAVPGAGDFVRRKMEDGSLPPVHASEAGMTSAGARLNSFPPPPPAAPASFTPTSATPGLSAPPVNVGGSFMPNPMIPAPGFTGASSSVIDTGVSLNPGFQSRRGVPMMTGNNAGLVGGSDHSIFGPDRDQIALQDSLADTMIVDAPNPGFLGFGGRPVTDVPNTEVFSNLPPLMNGPPTCKWCRRSATEIGRPLEWCGGCQRVQYCSQDCQRADFPSHRVNCGGVARR